MLSTKASNKLKPTKILMVCLGNICRSPVAEGVMRQVAHQYDLNVEIDSAGTAGYHIGEHPDPRSVRNAAKNKVDISQLRARKFSTEDFDRFDYIFAMDANNNENILNLAVSPVHAAKVRLLTDIKFPGEGIEVPDPYYGTERDFQSVFELCTAACEAIAIHLKQHA